ncbi:MAG TPA: hypothetical protein VLR26_07490 [Frankiaceae bacterium]|nr:hypothetical protein [Frankiaceae bacterium]
MLVSLVVVAILVTRDDPTPVIAGDSLVTQAAVWGGKVLHGTSVIASVGHDPCQDQAKIKHAGAKRPKRLVLAYTGNAYGPTTGQALALHGVQGLGLAYAGCLRHIRESVPDRVHVVVVQALACGPTDVHGSPVLNDYLRAATLGGTYPSGERVAPMRNASYSTAVDDRMTPGHRFRDRDEGGVLRSDDQVHLTVHGATVYAAVLTGLANGP